MATKSKRGSGAKASAAKNKKVSIAEKKVRAGWLLNHEADTSPEVRSYRRNKTAANKKTADESIRKRIRGNEAKKADAKAAKKKGTPSGPVAKKARAKRVVKKKGK
tara:strand:+ start:788 stop:1105 length:318 start_codon:yes stop_codon:yes gene_type:complete